MSGLLLANDNELMGQRISKENITAKEFKRHRHQRIGRHLEEKISEPSNIG